jgi:hypothetical protein
MKGRKTMIFLLAAALPLAVACHPKQGAEYAKKSDTATQVSDKEKPGVNRPGDLSPAQAQRMIDDVAIGHQVESDGTIANTNQGHQFQPGEPVFIAMSVKDAPAGTAVRVDLYGPGDQKVAQDQKPVTAGERNMAFKLADTGGSWKPGEYHADVWVGDEKVDTQRFEISDQNG